MDVLHSPLPGQRMLPGQNTPSFHTSQQTYTNTHADGHWSNGIQLPSAQSSSPPVSPGSELSTLNAVFVSHTIQTFGLDDNQARLLHGMYQVGCLAEGLSRPDLGTRIFATAAVFSSENRILAAIQKSGAAHHPDEGATLDQAALLKEISIRLEDTFVLTADQLMNVRRVCQNIVYSTNRTSYKHMHVNVETELRLHIDKYNLSNVYGRGPAREAKLMSYIKRIGSNVRNQFRQDLRNSVMPGPRCCNLDKFTMACALKYRTASISSKPDPGYNRHNSLLRRFSWEHKHLLENKEVFVDSDPTGVQSLPDTESTAETGSKRKAAGGRVPSDQDFWAQVDAWFLEQIDIRGDDFGSPEWKSFIDESIRLDKARFEHPIPAPVVAAPQPVPGIRRGGVGNGDVPVQAGHDEMMSMFLASAGPLHNTVP